MLKLKLQYFGHLMWTDVSLEKSLLLGKIEGRRRRGCQKMRWLDGITNAMNMNLGKLREMVQGGRGREAWRAAVHWVTKSWTWLDDWTTVIKIENHWNHGPRETRQKGPFRDVILVIPLGRLPEKSKHKVLVRWNSSCLKGIRGRGWKSAASSEHIATAESTASLEKLLAPRPFRGCDCPTVQIVPPFLRKKVRFNIFSWKWRPLL